ncbi:glycoside hydrolase family 68 protein [Clavibacter michiganensis]|uniref:glycoside hydrolase family 68 protein n=1 Tax=Clavibacter michiganensis TaxID=28447 RepID=UPI001BE0C9C8|nr:glycoside hydrolase family 68 protein [Clavibacter michiganensis]MBT1635290.1 glycoside hydrolase family 68 protein [Clavibacter michiganensis]
MTKRIRRGLSASAAATLVVASALLAGGSAQAAGTTPPRPTVHTQKAYAPEDDFTAHWTRADAKQIAKLSDPKAPPRTNSMPSALTMPQVPQDFPTMTDQAYVWDTWPLTDSSGQTYSVDGYDVIFALTAPRTLSFDDRHTYAKIGYFTRPTGIPAEQRPENGGWTYQGNVFEDGVTDGIFPDQSFTQQAEWSGSARIMADGTVKLFFTDVAFYRDAKGQDVKPADPVISLSQGRLEKTDGAVKVAGFETVTPLLRPDGQRYQTNEQNWSTNFRDPFTFTDPDHPGKTYMVFEANVAGKRGEQECDATDLGYRKGDPAAEDPKEVTASGANYQMASIGLAVADDADLTKWHYLDPLLESACVTDQTERPEVVIENGKHYLFTISHRSTFAKGMDGPEGVYGFVGNGLRSDYKPMNGGSGLVLGNPTNLNYAGGTAYAPDYNQTPGAFQAYSSYILPGGLVESFIDAVGSKESFRRGGTLGPTVKLEFDGDTSKLDRGYGEGGLGAYADIPTTKAFDPAHPPQ